MMGLNEFMNYNRQIGKVKLIFIIQELMLKEPVLNP
jgi:hypothetical protein